MFIYQHNTSWPCMPLLWICNSKLTSLLSISLSDNRIDPKSLPGSDSKEWEDLSYSKSRLQQFVYSPSQKYVGVCSGVSEVYNIQSLRINYNKWHFLWSQHFSFVPERKNLKNFTFWFMNQINHLRQNILYQ